MRRLWRPGRAADRRQRAAGSSTCLSVIDPGTTTLRLLIVEERDDGATVWGWAQGPEPSTADADMVSLIAFGQEVEAQAEAMAQELAGRWILPDQLLVGLPASQLRGRAWSVTQRRARPDRPVEEQELVGLLGRALRLAKNRLSDQDSGWLLVDAVPVSFSIDGRGVTDPVGFRAEEIATTVFAALAREETVQTWGLVARELEFSTLILMAAPMALAAGLSEPQGMLLDVGGATTDLIWWRAGRPIALDSLPAGGMALTRSLIEEWNLSAERAERLKQAYSGGRLPEEAGAQVLQVLSPALRHWLEETEAALIRLNQDELLPQRLYLLGGGSMLPEMMEAVRSLAWSQMLRFARYPEVERLRPTSVTGVVNRTDLGRDGGDVSALALAAWAARQNRPLDGPSRLLSEIWQAKDQYV